MSNAFALGPTSNTVRTADGKVLTVPKAGFCFHPERVKVIGLGDSDKEPMIDDEHGILCEARMEGQVVTLPLGELDNAKGQSNRRLLDDYSYWLFNWG